MYRSMGSYLAKMVDAKAISVDKESEVGCFEVYVLKQNKDLVFGWIYYSEMEEIEKELIPDNKKLNKMCNTVIGRFQDSNHKKKEWIEEYIRRCPNKEKVEEIKNFMGDI